MKYRAFSLAIIAMTLFSHSAFAQEIEARRWAHLPIGTNIVSVAGVHSEGDVFLDPVLKIEDGEVNVDTAVTSFIHAFDLYGKTARLDVQLPYQKSKWSGLLNGEQRSVKRQGWADPFVRLSVNLLGAPALKGKEFRAYKVAQTTNTIVGASLGLRLPLGRYDEDKLFNIGNNRYVIRPQVGVVHTRDAWSYELTGSVNFYTDNDEFWQGQEREQDPLYVLQTHIVYTFKNRVWLSTALGYDYGGETSVDGIDKEDHKENAFFSASLGFPITKSSSIKLAYVGGQTQENVGSDINHFILGYSGRF